MNDVKLYDNTNIDTFIWPNTEEGRKGKEYLHPLILEGVDAYIKNVRTKMYLITHGQFFLPFTLNNTEYENSYVTSNYYGILLYEEFLTKKHPVALKFQAPLLAMGKKIMQWIKINRCIILNNWLLTNNLPLEIPSNILNQMIDFLKVKFPTHLIMYRNIDGLLRENLISTLKANRFHLMKVREILFYDPAKKNELTAKELAHHRKDIKLLDKLEYQIFRSEDITDNDLPRLIELYEKIYVHKHTSYSPRYSEKFLKHIIEKKILTFIGLKRGGVIEGIMGYFLRDNAMINPFFGYDINLPHNLELYRLLTVLLLKESENLGVILNYTSGGEETKKKRGLKPYSEFMAFHCKHLPSHQRFFWKSMACMYDRKMNGSEKIKVSQ